MAVLLLRLSAPLQSWGTTLKLKDHETDTMPSKSGVIGMVAAAFGRRRDEDISDLRSLRFGVRCDRCGSILCDYHTASVEGEKNTTYVSHRFYLQDACFTAGLEGEREFLEACADALRAPVFPPYLGRRSCVPDPGLVVGIYEDTLENVLKTVETETDDVYGRQENGRKRICVESYDTGDRMRHDNPVSFDFHDRRYSYRMEKELSADE